MIKSRPEPKHKPVDIEFDLSVGDDEDAPDEDVLRRTTRGVVNPIDINYIELDE